MEAFMEAEGLAMRAGPRESLEKGLLLIVRDAITRRRKIEFNYLLRGTGRQSRQRGSALRSALRQPRFPGGTGQPREGAEALAARERKPRPDHR